MRIVIIECNEYTETRQLEFDPKEMKDSEALHHLLCEVDPGDTYSVTFATL